MGNLTPPPPVRNSEFTSDFAPSLHLPALLPLPLLAAKLLFTGEMVDDAMLSSQFALSTVLLEHGFEFLYSDVDEGMESVNS